MSVADVREFEQLLVEKGTSLAELMRRAGAAVALQAARLVRHGSVVVLCGMGNNGGDGWVAADNLARHGYEVSVVAPATPAVMRSEQARLVATRAAEMGVPVHVAPEPEELEELLLPADVVIDACFGIGFHGEMPEPYATWARVVDEVFDGHLVAVDIPSGIDATSGMADGPHFEADVTVTMFAAKPGLVSGMGRAAVGRIVVASVLEGEEGLEDVSDAASAFVLEERDYVDVLPEPDPLQDKYTRGRVLVVAGSTRYPGAAVMAAQAAARSGAGYVTLAVPAPVVPIAQAHLLSIPVVGLPADPEGSFGVEASDRVGELAARADVVLAGPGMTTSLGACEVVRALLRTERALVLDADALNAVVRICAGSAEAHPDALRREAPLVLTPHRRELARLMGGEVERTATLAGAMDAAQALAWAVGSSDFCVVAKGPVSAVATIDSTLIPQPGPIALATAGTGDVLAGITASLLAQLVASMGEEELAEGIDSSDLLMLVAGADRVHAVAGELACRAHGSRGVIAPDVAELAGKAIDELLRRAERDFDKADEDEDDGLGGGAALADDDAARLAHLTTTLIEDDPADLEEPTPEHERLEKRPASAQGATATDGSACDAGAAEGQGSAAEGSVAGDLAGAAGAGVAVGREAEADGRPVERGVSGEVAPTAATRADAQGSSTIERPAGAGASVAADAAVPATPAGETTVMPVVGANGPGSAGEADRAAEGEPPAEKRLVDAASTAEGADVSSASETGKVATPAREGRPAVSAPSGEVTDVAASAGSTGAMPPFLAGVAGHVSSSAPADLAEEVREAVGDAHGQASHAGTPSAEDVSPEAGDAEASASSEAAPTASVPALEGAPESTATTAGAAPADADAPQTAVDTEAGVPPFLARMAAFVAEGSVPNGETGAFAAVAAAVEAPVESRGHSDGAEKDAPTAAKRAAAKDPAPTALRLPAFLSSALSGRPAGRTLDPQDVGADAPATFDAGITIAPPPGVSVSKPADAGKDAPAAASRPLKRGRSTGTSGLGLPKKKPNPVEAFHERATLRIGDEPVVPPDQRPSASKKPKGRSTKRGRRS